MKRDYIIRPFLSFTSKEILGYLSKHSIAFCEDSSNSSEKYLRNSIRHSVLPHIEDKMPGFKTQVQKSISHLRSENTILQHFIKDFEQEHFVTSSGIIKASKSALISFPHLGVLLYRILDKYRFIPAVCEQIAQSLEAEGGRIFESSTHILSTDTKNIQIRKKKKNLKGSIIIDGPGNYSLGNNTLAIESTSETVFSDSPNKQIVSIDESLFPLTLRFWKTGDKIQPLGMKGGKLLSDFFTDQKVNVLEKGEIPLLCKQDEVLWIVGYRISEKIKTQNNKVVYSLLFTFEE